LNDKLIDRLPEPEIAGAVIPWFSPKNRPTEERMQETAGLVEAFEK
jgi:GTP-binding protein HflX